MAPCGVLPSGFSALTFACSGRLQGDLSIYNLWLRFRMQLVYVPRSGVAAMVAQQHRTYRVRRSMCKR
nr:hypothetical protein CFP56_28472 [Quercus suber]